MSKAVLISINPKWVKEILNGKKTLEVRKTIPKLDIPFKCYIYCTKSKPEIAPFNIDNKWIVEEFSDETTFANGCTMNMRDTLNGKVVAEFICDYEWNIDMEMIMNPEVNTPKEVESLTTLTDMTIEELNNYLGKKVGYAWNIRDLQIYDNPKELSEFGIKKAPQSWCYVEDLSND